MLTKTRKQGNSVMITVPSSFNVGEGIVLEPKLLENGIFYEFVAPEDVFFDFDANILRDLMAEGFEGSALIDEFTKRKSKIPKGLKRLVKEARESSEQLSREELAKKIGL